MNIIPIGAAILFSLYIINGLYLIYKVYKEDKDFEKFNKQP